MSFTHSDSPIVPKWNSTVIVLLLLLSFQAAAQTESRTATHSSQNSAVTSAAQGSAQDAEKANLEKDKLRLEIEKLRLENANNERSLTTIRGWLNLLYGNVSVIVAIVLGFVGLFRYLRERREELLKREDERFEEVVKGLGSEQDQQRVSSAVLLPTFLRKGYERFYLQVFNLAAGNLRGQTEVITAVSAPVGGIPTLRRVTDHSAISTTPMGRSLTSVLRESYPRAREIVLKNMPKAGRDLVVGRYLNAAAVQLQRAFLAGVDFRDAWLKGASFREAILRGANLSRAVLEESDFSDAMMIETNLQEANIQKSKFTDANLEDADLSRARADNANFSNGKLARITMEGGTIGGAEFSDADLSKATFAAVSFLSADNKRANPEDAKNLTETVFKNIKTLTEDQIEKCKKKGAKFEP